jgi:hypothetical protein
MIWFASGARDLSVLQTTRSALWLTKSPIQGYRRFLLHSPASAGEVKMSSAIILNFWFPHMSS